MATLTPKQKKRLSWLENKLQEMDYLHEFTPAQAKQYDALETEYYKLSRGI